MDLGLKGKRAWVVGASSGMGKAIAMALAQEGASVAISARDEDKLRSGAADLDRAGAAWAGWEALDVTDVSGIESVAARVIDRLEGLDILVANQGGPPPGRFSDLDGDDFDAAYRLLLSSVFHLTRCAVAPMQEQRGGVVVYVTSTSTKESLPQLFLSNVMRMGILGMAKSLSIELGESQIRVLCASPGRIATNRAEELDGAAARRQGVAPEEVRRRAEAGIPLGRYGLPVEFGETVAFLCSERASYVSGTNVVIDGAKTRAVA